MPEEYQVGMLLSAVSDQTLIVINALPDATSGDRQKLSNVIKLLEKFCLAGESILFERHNFYKRKQREDQPIEHFITAVRTLAQTCDFTQGGTDFSDQMVRDRPLCGMCDDNVRQRLLAKDKLDLETCIKDCRSTSITRQQIQQMKTATATNGIPTDMAASDNVFAVTMRHCDYCGRAHERGLRLCLAYG